MSESQIPNKVTDPPPPYANIQQFPKKLPTVPKPNDSVISVNDGQGLIFDQATRPAFIKKVVRILCAQFFTASLIIIVVSAHRPTKLFIRENSWIILVAVIFYIGTYFTLSCIEYLRKQTPINYIQLVIFTFGSGTILGVISAHTPIAQVMVDMCLTIAVTITLYQISYRITHDFTGLRGSLLYGYMVMMNFSYMVFYINIVFIQVLIGVCGLILFSLFLLCDIQQMWGLERKFKFSHEEYILASLCIYLDTINLFISISNIAEPIPYLF